MGEKSRRFRRSLKKGRGSWCRSEREKGVGRVHFEFESLPREAELLWVEMMVVLVVETLGGLRKEKGLDQMVDPGKCSEKS